MRDLYAEFNALVAPQRRRVHLLLCEHALAAWMDYLSTNPPLHYIETVVGTRQTVDVALPADALAAARLGRDDANIDHRYAEPIAALHDDDLTFPDHVAFAYYAIYNAFCMHVLGRQMDGWLIVNQALSSSSDEAQWHTWLRHALDAIY